MRRISALFVFSAVLLRSGELYAIMWKKRGAMGMKMLFSTVAAALMLTLTACFGTGVPKPEKPSEQEQPGGWTLQDPFQGRKFDQPVGMEVRANESDRVYIIEQPGRIVSMNLQAPGDKPLTVLDITDRVHDDGGEQGLLGLAFHPDKTGQAYVNYTTDTHTVIARFDFFTDDSGTIDPSSEQILLTFEQPYDNHNGGQLAFGPDGYLYIATGDGGSGGDPQNNSQNLQSLLGKILRIDVNGTQGEVPYAIPPDNPFLQDGLPEIYAYGLRNPWRFSFDDATGRLWAADVGQSSYEEINLVEKGKNYGWRIQEGPACFNPKKGCETAGLEQPIHAYGRELGVSVTGGYVYRGEQLPVLQDAYIYGDYGSGTIWALRLADDGTTSNETLLSSGANITSFGRDAAGELYVCTQEGSLLRLQQN